jgi:hypothetical protein
MYAEACVHTFTPDVIACGFSHFIGLGSVLNPANGYLHDGTDIVLTVRISIQGDGHQPRDPTQGPVYVGLKNQGATCYVNALLQTLFHLPAFRKVVAESAPGQGAAEAC